MTSSHRYKIPEEERVPTHVSLVSNTKYISVVLDKLDPQQKSTFDDDCIGHVARLSELKLSAQLIYEMVNRYVHCRKKSKAWFMVNQRLARFGLPEFALITGLKCGPVPTGTEVDKILKKTRLQDKMFANMDRITCTNFEKVFLKCANRNGRYKLGMALIIEGVFNSRDRNVGVHPNTLSIVDDLEFFNSYPWGTVCFTLLIKSLLRGWGRKADLAKVNDCDKMTYTLYGFPLAVQIWAYEGIPKLRARFSSKTCDDILRMLRWSGTKQPHSRTYADFFEKTKVHLWATLRANVAELLQSCFADLVPLEDVVDPVLDLLVAQSTEIQECPVDDDVIRNDDRSLRRNKSRRGNTGGLRHWDLHHAEGGEEGDGDPVIDLPATSTSSQHPLGRHVSVEEIRALLNEQREAFERKLGDLREEMNTRFDGVNCLLRSWATGLTTHVSAEMKEFESRLVDLRKEMNTRFAGFESVLGGHVTGLRSHVTEEINDIRRRFDEVATELRDQNVADEYCGFGHNEGGGDVPRSDIFTPNASGKKHIPGEQVEAIVCNVPDVSITSAGGVGVLGSVYIACDIMREVSTSVPLVDACNDDQPVHDSIVAAPSTIDDPPTRRPRSLRLKKASASTRTLFTRSGRKRGKRDA